MSAPWRNDGWRAPTPEEVDATAPRPFTQTSSTQLDSFILCNMKWWLGWPRRFKAPPTAAMQFGTDRHTELETFWKTGAEPTHILAKVASRYLPERTQENLDQIFSERAFDMETRAGVRFIGKVDFTDLRDVERPLVRDFKTTSQPKYAKTSDELKSSIQMVSYAEDVRRIIFERYQDDTFIEAIHLEHLYMRTKGAKSVWPVKAAITLDELAYNWERTEQLVVQQTQVARLPMFADVQQNFDACDEYGGCPFKPTCHAQVQSDPKARLRAAMKEEMANGPKGGILPPDAPDPYKHFPLGDAQGELQMAESTPSPSAKLAGALAKFRTNGAAPPAGAPPAETAVVAPPARKAPAAPPAPPPPKDVTEPTWSGETRVDIDHPDGKGVSHVVQLWQYPGGKWGVATDVGGKELIGYGETSELATNDLGGKLLVAGGYQQVVQTLKESGPGAAAAVGADVTKTRPPETTTTAQTRDPKAGAETPASSPPTSVATAEAPPREAASRARKTPAAKNTTTAPGIPSGNTEGFVLVLNGFVVQGDGDIPPSSVQLLDKVVDDALARACVAWNQANPKETTDDVRLVPYGNAIPMLEDAVRGQLPKSCFVHGHATDNAATQAVLKVLRQHAMAIIVGNR